MMSHMLLLSMSHVQVTPTGWMQGPMGDVRVDIHYLNDAMDEDAVATTGGKGATSAVGPATSSATAAGGGILSSKLALMVLTGTLLVVIAAAVVVPCTILLLHPQASRVRSNVLSILYDLPSPPGVTPMHALINPVLQGIRQQQQQP